MNGIPRKDTMRSLLPLFLLAPLALLGCSSQADTAYRGEALASLSGTVSVSSTSPSPLPALEAALLWNGTSPGSGKVLTGPTRRSVGTSIPVSGTFPAQFELQIYDPPPAQALFPCSSAGSGNFAQGEVAAVPQGQASFDVASADLYGIVTDYYLAYADQDIPAGTICQGGNAVTKGYHLYHYTPTPDIPGCVRQAPDDPSCNGPYPYTEVPFTTEQTLVLDHQDSTATPPPAPTPSP